jgi:hypothetical protein
MRPASSLDRRVREVEALIGKPIVLRSVRSSDRNLRGRITSIPGAMVLEYRDETAGYFWDCDIVRELLEHLAAGGGPADFRDDAPGFATPPNPDH